MQSLGIGKTVFPRLGGDRLRTSPAPDGFVALTPQSPVRSSPQPSAAETPRIDTGANCHYNGAKRNHLADARGHRGANMLKVAAQCS